MSENLFSSNEHNLPNTWNRKLFPDFAVIAVGRSNASLCGEGITNPDNLPEELNMKLLNDPLTVRRIRLGLEFHFREYLSSYPEYKGVIDFLTAIRAATFEGYKFRDEAHKNGDLEAAYDHNYQIQKLLAVTKDVISDPNAGIASLN